jgi:muramoyltetrapeptide carboxypeptidase
LLKPRPLHPGSTIGVAALSGPVEPDRLDRGITALESRGYRVVEADNVRRRDGFLAGSDEERAAGYRALLRDPTVDAIFFARGGYGSARVLPHLDADEARAHPKIHLGGSDLTALFAFLARRSGLVTFYGPMVAVDMADEGRDRLDWEEVLRGNLPAPHELSPDEVLVAGEAEGFLFGGCLSLLASLAGTPDAVDARRGGILFWEDVGEELYRIDRMLTQLERSGTFEGLRGMIIGSIAPGRRTGAESPEEVRSYLAHRFAGAPYPVVSGFPAGHRAENRTLPLDVRVRLDASARRVEFLEIGTL